MGCTDPQKPEDKPNILWVVWDTVRADRLSIYGHDKPTTPFLETWSSGARIYDNCISTAGSTTPSHASMFTGLLPSEHGTHAEHQFLDDRYDTIAEILRQAGYQTYLYAANPHISESENFQQGFDVEEHPWDLKYRDRALRIVQRKITPEDRSSELPGHLRSGRVSSWGIKASGAIAQTATLDWLSRRDPSKPYFAFLNYMEAHRPFIPDRSYRQRMMKPEHVDRSYHVDRSWTPMWLYTVGLLEYTREELEIMAATYDATLLELDDLFRNLISALERKGHLQDTIVILTADHGEHLGEHHMLDHQFAIYDPLIRVPLLIHYPKRFKPDRDAGPVVTFDLFPTLLELTGIDPPPGFRTAAVSLLSPRQQRARVAEYPAVFSEPFKAIKSVHPTWDPTPWSRRLRALLDGPFKYIWASDGRHELYDLDKDPLETRNLVTRRESVRLRMAQALQAQVDAMSIPGSAQRVPEMTAEQRRRLESLGYLAPVPDKAGRADRPDKSD
jgi:arylsulfatase A-like enzyme